MSIYGNYIIILLISLLSFVIAVRVRNQEIIEKTRTKIIDEKYIWLVLIGMIVYYIVRVVTGWRFSIIYIEICIVLITLIYLDYLIIVKCRYSKKINVVFRSIRFISITIPFLLIGIVIFMTAISFGYAATEICKVFPLDTSYAEQNVYKNIYLYKDECKDLFVFKKTFLMFEKDVATFGNNSITVFGGGISRDSLATGHIVHYKDSITITGSKNNSFRDNYLRIIIIQPNKLKIESIIPTYYPGAYKKPYLNSNLVVDQVIDSVTVKL